jgi:signal transduction histidine kinase
VWVVAALPVALAAGWLFGLVLNGRPAVGVYVGGWFILLGGMAASLLIAQRAARRRDQAVALRRSSVEAAAAERGRLRRELHDGLGASLAALRLQLDAVRTALPLAADEASVRLGRVEATLASALEELRRIVDGLRPVALDELGLPGALNIQGRALNAAGTAPTVEVIVDPAVPDLPDAVAVALLRISAEALTNAVRHAASSHCTVRLGWQDPVAVLRVEDDGTGMVPARIGHGLATMRERAEELGGTLTVLPASPQGTVVTAVIPSAL